MTKCECGCGGEAKEGNRFIHGHNIRVNNPMNNPESCKKVSDYRRNSVASDETKQKMSVSHTGIKRGPHTEEAKRKIGDRHRGKTKENDESVRRMAEKLTGRTKENHEGIKRGAEKKKGRTKENHEGIRKRAEKIRGRTKENNESIRKMANSLIKFYQEHPEARPIGTKNPMYGKVCSEKEKQRKREISKALWQDPKYIEKVLTAIHKALHIKPNKPEKLIYELLQNILPNEYAINVEGHIIIDRKVPDFVNINGQKKVIELYGDYWHRNDNPQDRIDLFKKYGYDTLVIWEHELENPKIVINKILKFHNLPSLSCTKQLTIN